MSEHVTKILNGEGLATQVRASLKKRIMESGIQPGLAVILVGHDPASEIYVQFKAEASEEVGMYLETYEFEDDIDERKLLKCINKLNKNKKIHGILVQLPLPDHINTHHIMNSIDPIKDVDGFHPENIGWLSIGEPEFMPATTLGIWQLLESAHIDVKGKHVVMVGASNIVGKPTAALLQNKKATVTVCNSATEDLGAITKQADILITATGKPSLITADMVKKGAVVIDAGIARIEGTVYGDVDYEEVSKKVDYITPVPGGVGPMTVASLLENTWIAACRINGVETE